MGLINVQTPATVSVLSLPATSGPVSLQLGDVDGNGVVDAVVAASSAVLPRLMWLESPDRAAPTVAGVVCVPCVHSCFVV